MFWTPTATTLGANSTFKGTVIDDPRITIGSNVNWIGRALSFGGTVSTDATTISILECLGDNGNGDTSVNGVIEDTTEVVVLAEEATGEESTREKLLTVSEVFVNDEGDFEFVFAYLYADSNWLTIYDSEGNLVYRTDVANQGSSFKRNKLLIFDPVH